MSKHAVVVIPTYNEKENIIPLLSSVLRSAKRMPDVRLSILVVDDNSPDGTAELVKKYRYRHPNVHLLTGEKYGLGIAYIRGFIFALTVLSPDIIVQMDADFSHDPNDIPRLIAAVTTPESVVIGSRYTPGGSTPSDWPFIRLLVSQGGNLVARHIAGLRPIQDCTAGFKALSAELLKKIDLTHIHAYGYSFQMNLLYAALRQGAAVTEVPIHFVDRTAGVSKIRLNDMTEFIWNAFHIRAERLFTSLRLYGREILLGLAGSAVAFLTFLLAIGFVSIQSVGLGLFFLLSLAIAVQCLFTLFGMIYAWEEPERVENNRSPQKFHRPRHSFTAILPALHEAEVIGDTIRAVADIEYPEDLKEILVICRPDDGATIAAAESAIKGLGKPNIHLLIPDFMPKNKPEKLNFGLTHARHDIVCVFDAEDSPHQDIYHVVNTVLIRDQVDVVQSGVQLVNFRSRWFSTLNVLEYFFWFKSVLHLFARQGVIPLGGNTVFFKQEWLRAVGGWDKECLTEDADIGIKLSSAGAKIRIIYDEIHATQEETPSSFRSFVKQRTRWNQGFLQIYKKGDWKRLPTMTQRLLVAYILLWPEIQAALFVYVALALFMMISVKLPIVLALISLIPLYILVMHLIILNIGLYEFTKKFNVRYPWRMPLKVMLTFVPFQLGLGISALRAVYRELRHESGWEKTEHVNAHRLMRRSSLLRAKEI